MYDLKYPDDKRIPSMSFSIHFFVYPPMIERNLMFHWVIELSEIDQ